MKNLLTFENINFENQEKNPDLLSLTHLRLPQVAGLISCSQRTWLRWVKQKNAPPPVRLGPGVVVWRVRDIQKWLDKKGVES